MRAGDPCPRLRRGELTIRRGIEIGHIFQLGRRFADAFALDALGPDGKPVRITMGSYGIGVSRAVAAIAEQHHDERGLVWPRAVAPADVHVVRGRQGRPDRRARWTSASELAGAGLRRARRRPGRRLGRGQVHRRRADRRAVGGRGRAAGWPKELVEASATEAFPTTSRGLCFHLVGRFPAKL